MMPLVLSCGCECVLPRDIQHGATARCWQHGPVLVDRSQESNAGRSLMGCVEHIAASDMIKHYADKQGVVLDERGVVVRHG